MGINPRRLRAFPREPALRSTHFRIVPIPRGVGPGQSSDDRGFTLVETLIAMLLLAIVMASLAPMFFGTFRATTTTNARSVATSLAVEASEQIRAYPYYEIGYYVADQPSACAGASSLAEVNLDSGQVTTEPLHSLATSSTVNHVPYTIQRCVYWVDSTVAADTQAYKKAVVTVYWQGQGTTLSVSQTSSIYPGGQGTYLYGKNDQIPNSSSVNCTGVGPGTPSGVNAVDDSTAPTNTIDVSWNASNPAADYYVVEYTTTNPGNSAIDQVTTNYTVSPETTATYLQITVGAGTTYYIQVQAVACGQPSQNSSTVTATTTSSATTTTTSSSTTTTTIATCSLYNLSVVPTGGTGAVTSVAIDANNGAGGGGKGSMHDYASNTFSLTLNSSNTANCSNVYVAYKVAGGSPTPCTTGQTGCGTDWAPLSPSGTGTFVGTASTTTSDATGWGQTGLSFVVYIGSNSTAVAYSPSTATNVSTCTYKKNSACT